MVMTLRKDISQTSFRRQRFRKWSPKLLLICRIPTRLADRFRCSSVPGTTCRERYDPGTVMKTRLSSWSPDHKAFRKGRLLDIEDTTRVGTAPDMALLTKLSVSQQLPIDFCCAIMDAQSDVDATLTAAVYDSMV